jgi:hypothetical protein
VRASTRTCRLLLLAYPPAWRQQHGAELTGITLDAADAAGRDRLAVGTVVDLVGHGLAMRVRRGVARRGAPVGPGRWAGGRGLALRGLALPVLRLGPSVLSPGSVVFMLAGVLVMRRATTWMAAVRQPWPAWFDLLALAMARVLLGGMRLNVGLHHLNPRLATAAPAAAEIATITLTGAGAVLYRRRSRSLIDGGSTPEDGHGNDPVLEWRGKDRTHPDRRG